jgi:hypothetical protein
MKSLDGGGSSKRYKEISDRASMATSQGFLLQNLNEVSMIPKHIKMLIINDAEALVTFLGNNLTYLVVSAH